MLLDHELHSADNPLTYLGIASKGFHPFLVALVDPDFCWYAMYNQMNTDRLGKFCAMWQLLIRMERF